MKHYLSHLKSDIPAGVVVFLVALPLCLGIAMASGVPLFSGLIAGLVGGVLVSWLSGSQLSVAGPAAGLTAVVIAAIATLGSFEAFLLSVVVAGIIQLVVGFLKAGKLAAFFPASLIKGMLAAIGLILIMKQLPHALGYLANFNGGEPYSSHSEVLSFFWQCINYLKSTSRGAILVCIGAILLMKMWEILSKKWAVLSIVPGPLLAVIWGVWFNIVGSRWVIGAEMMSHHLVSLPVMNTLSDMMKHVRGPDFSQWANPNIYIVAGTLAIVASIETLLSLEAADKMDPLKRVAPTDRELKAQGIGNIVSGLMGGLPITAVIVRSAANVNAGGKTKVSAFVHGILILVSVMFFSQYLNAIPLSCLAAILIMTGYKLTKPSLFLEMYRRGWTQFLPFVVTVVAILSTDLLKGMGIGLIVSLCFVVRANFHSAISVEREDDHYLIRFKKDVSFLNKMALRDSLLAIEPNSSVIIDAAHAQFVDDDILDTIFDFSISAQDAGVRLKLLNFNIPKTFQHKGLTPNLDLSL